MGIKVYVISMSSTLINFNFQKHHDSSDEDEGREFLKSTAHHIVNEPGAYVPNSVSTRDPFFLQ